MNGAFAFFRGGAVIAVCYVALLRVLQLVSLRFRSTDFKELEIVVLRHELVVLLGRRSVRKFARSSCGWHARIRDGATCVPWANSRVGTSVSRKDWNINGRTAYGIF